MHVATLMYFLSRHLKIIISVFKICPDQILTRMYMQLLVVRPFLYLTLKYNLLHIKKANQLKIGLIHKSE